MENALKTIQQVQCETTERGMPYDLGERLEPAKPEQVKDALKTLAEAYEKELSRVRVAVYFEAILGNPAWAICIACEEFRIGTAPNHTNKAFMPTPAQLGERVRQIVQPHRNNAAPRPEPQSSQEFKQLGPIVKLGTEESRAEFAAKMMANLDFGPSQDDGEA